MFSKIVVISSLAALALAASIPQEPVAIISSKADVSPDGSFSWSYESGDGSSQQQSGREIQPDGGQSVQGNAQWYDPEGNLHEISYTADENGYLPSSADVPIAPQIPPAILRALQWNLEHPEEETANP